MFFKHILISFIHSKHCELKLDLVLTVVIFVQDGDLAGVSTMPRAHR